MLEAENQDKCPYCGGEIRLVSYPDLLRGTLVSARQCQNCYCEIIADKADEEDEQKA